MTRLLRLVRDKPDAVEADLRRFYGVWRDGLPWRRVAALIRHLPSEAAIFGHGWSLHDMLLSDLMHALGGEHHPSDPRLHVRDETLRTRLTAGAKRAAERRKRLGITGSVLRRKG